MTANVRQFYTELGIELPERDTANVPVRCFTNPGAHSHGDRTPSCSVNTADGTFYCHGCGDHGGAYDAAIFADRTPGEAMGMLKRHDFPVKDSAAWDTARNGRAAKSQSEPEAASDPGEAVEIKFMSPAELRASVPEEPPWIVHGYIADGAMTILAGKPKAGKSTFSLALIDAIANRASNYFGHAINGGPVVYVSEEGAATLSHKAGGGDIRFATRDSAWPRPDWETLITAAVREAKRVSARLIAVDTFAAWAGLGPESEKDAGAIQRAMEPLVQATRTGLAVLLVVHTRKGGGEDGEGIRGSSALAGAADIILELDRVQGAPPRQRKLLSLSRYPQTPGVLVIEHDATTGAWSVIGEGADRGDAREITDRAALMAALDHDETLTRQELEQAMGSPERQWHTTIERLIETGAVIKTGAGKKGDPYRYKKPLTDSAQPPAQNPRRNGNSAGFEDAAQPPLRVQHQNQHSPETFRPSRCAASNPGAETDSLAVDADAEFERIAAKFGDNER